MYTKKELVLLNQEAGGSGIFSNEKSFDSALKLAQSNSNWLFQLSYLLQSLLADFAFREENRKTALLLSIHYLEEEGLGWDRELLLRTIFKISQTRINNPIKIARSLYHVVREKN